MRSRSNNERTAQQQQSSSPLPVIGKTYQIIYAYILRTSIVVGVKARILFMPPSELFFFFFLNHHEDFHFAAQLVGGFTLSDLPDKPWSQVSSLLPPGKCIQFVSRIGFSIPTARRFSSNAANSRSRAFRYFFFS